MLCERNKTCGREGSASASPGPRPWFYRCVNRICVAFTHVPGDLERKTHHLFFFWSPMLPAPAPAGPSSLPPGARMGTRTGGSVSPGSWDGCEQVPGTCISPPAASRASSFLSCPPSEGSSIRRAQRAARGGHRPPGTPRPSELPGLPLTPLGAGVRTGPPPNPGVIPESGSRAGGR